MDTRKIISYKNKAFWKLFPSIHNVFSSSRYLTSLDRYTICRRIRIFFSILKYLIKYLVSFVWCFKKYIILYTLVNIVLNNKLY